LKRDPLSIIAVLVALLAFWWSVRTFNYMRERDLVTDTRTGWIEVHKAMVSLNVERALVMSEPGGGYGPTENPQVQRVRDYTLASAQLRGQLDRLNDDPLVVELALFLDDHKLEAQWQTAEYENAFNSLAQEVALKSRPK
jgi:hypothetical protein